MSYDNVLVHQLMIEDAIRTDGYRKAIEQTIQQGDSVLDFCCGTGTVWKWSLKTNETQIEMDDFVHKAWIGKNVPKGWLT